MNLHRNLRLLGWYAAVAFASWALWGAGHPVWSVIVALLGTMYWEEVRK